MRSASWRGVQIRQWYNGSEGCVIASENKVIKQLSLQYENLLSRHPVFLGLDILDFVSRVGEWVGQYP